MVVKSHQIVVVEVSAEEGCFAVDGGLVREANV